MGKRRNGVVPSMQDFENIYEAYFSYVFKYTLALSKNDLVAEEITAEVFFKALKKLDSFDGRSDIRTWLCQIAKNTYYSYLRKNKRQAEIIPLEEAPADCVIEAAFDDNETARRIHKILHELDEPYKEVFTLRVFGELPFAQIAELFGRTESWARVTYHRAKGKIATRVKEEEA